MKREWDNADEVLRHVRNVMGDRGLIPDSYFDHRQLFEAIQVEWREAWDAIESYLNPDYDDGWNPVADDSINITGFVLDSKVEEHLRGKGL